jgi:hypothetical protein
MKPSLHPLELSALSEIRVAYAGMRLRPSGVCNILVASFSGVYREGSSGGPDARFIEALGQAAVIAWEPEGMILDFSNLEYSSGDDLKSILNIGERVYGNESLPVAVVVGPKSEKAARSLFNSATLDSGSEWIFSEFEPAFSHIEREMADLDARLVGTKRPPIL